MGTTVVTQAGNSDIVSQEYSKTVVYGAGNSNQSAQEIKTLLHISGSKGLVFDAANGALTNGSTGAKNIVDFEGISRATPSLTIRRANARFVKNYCTTPENYGGGNWYQSVYAASTVSSEATNPPPGFSSSIKIVSDAASRGYTINHSFPAGTTVRYSFWARGETGTEGIRVKVHDGVDNYIAFTSQWKRYAIKNVTSGTVSRIISNAASTVYIQGILFEDVSASVNKSASDYVNSLAFYNSYKNNYTTPAGTTYVGYQNVVFPGPSYNNILCVGDSFGDNAGEWVDLLNKSESGAVVDNWTQAGAQLSGDIGVNFAAHIGDHSYDSVIIQGGVNDINNSKSLAQMQAAISSMIALCGATTHIYIINVSPWSASASSTAQKIADTIAYNAWLSSYTATDSRIRLVDIYTPLGDPANPTAMLDVNTSDNLHPSSLGSYIILHALLGQIGTRGIKYLNPQPALLHEPATTNLATNPRDFTNAAWVKTNATAAKTATGTDGATNSASTLTATANDGTALQTVTSASANRISGAFVKRRTGTGAIYMTQDNGATWTEITITSAWTAAPYTIPAATVTDPIMGFKLAVSGDAIDVDYFQHELGGYITSPISGARTIDSIKVPLSANVNFPQTKGIAFIKVTPQFANSATAKSLLCTSSAATDFVHDNGSGEIAINDGTNTATTSGLGGWAVGDILLIAAIWIIDTMSIHVSKNGGAWVDSANATYDGAFPAGANLLLCNANTDSILINSIKIKSTTKSLADAQAWAKASAIYEAI
jgi:hypothetical protein